MEIKAATGDITGIKTGAMVINHYEDVKQPEGITADIDKELNGAITKLIKQKKVKNKHLGPDIIHIGLLIIIIGGAISLFTRVEDFLYLFYPLDYNE